MRTAVIRLSQIALAFAVTAVFAVTTVAMMDGSVRFDQPAGATAASADLAAYQPPDPCLDCLS